MSIIHTSNIFWHTDDHCITTSHLICFIARSKEKNPVQQLGYMMGKAWKVTTILARLIRIVISNQLTWEQQQLDFHFQSQP